MKNKYSIFSLIKNAFSQHENWKQAWGDPVPKKEYEAIIIGGGNTGRNTTIIRSNYLWDASAGLYDHALKIWENLSQELNYNVYRYVLSQKPIYLKDFFKNNPLY